VKLTNFFPLFLHLILFELLLSICNFAYPQEIFLSLTRVFDVRASKESSEKLFSRSQMVSLNRRSFHDKCFTNTTTDRLDRSGVS
jgi:hypothetical protein